MKNLAVLICVCATVLACSDNERAYKVLADEGYTQIKVTGYAWIGCGKDDEVHTGFSALSVVGRPVSGVVCCGYDIGLGAKGCTIRKD